MELKNIIQKERDKQRAYLSEPEEEWNHSYIRGTVAAFDTVLEMLKKASDGVLDNVVCSPHGTKIRKGTKVCSYGDKTTWGYMDDWDDSEGCWRIRLPESKEGFMWWPDDEITILSED